MSDYPEQLDEQAAIDLFAELGYQMEQSRWRRAARVAGGHHVGLGFTISCL